MVQDHCKEESCVLVADHDKRWQDHADGSGTTWRVREDGSTEFTYIEFGD